MTYQFNICVDEGIRYIGGHCDGGVTFNKIIRFALTHGAGGGESCESAPVFDFDSADGCLQMAVLPEIQQVCRRQGTQYLIASRVKSGDQPDGGKRGKKNGEARNGGDDGGKAQIHFPRGKEVPKLAYPAGPTLSAVGEIIGYLHRPLDRVGRAMRYAFSAHSGCKSRKGPRTFAHQSRIKPVGLNWAESYEIARMGGLPPSKRIEPNDVDDYRRALREKNALEIKRAIGESAQCSAHSAHP